MRHKTTIAALLGGFVVVSFFLGILCLVKDDSQSAELRTYYSDPEA
jgi:hypothetical protein